MGTYTTNYNLFMPTVGETGWGTLVNGNFTTIDTTMKGLDTRLTVVENEVNGALSCTSVTASGKITGNGGIAGTTGTFSGAVTAASFNGVSLGANSYNNMPIGLNYMVGTSATNICGLRPANGVNNFTIAEYTSQFQVIANTAYTIKPLRDYKFGLPISSLPSLPSGVSYILRLDFDKTYTASTVTITSPFSKTITRASSTATYNDFTLTQAEALSVVQKGITFKNNTTESLKVVRLWIKSTNNIYVAAY